MIIRTKRLYTRNNKLYIDSYTEYGRVRVATGLEDTRQNRKDINARFEEIVYKALRGETKHKSLTILKDVINDFFNDLQGIKKSTLLDYKSMGKQILKGLGNKDIRLFSVHNVGEWLASKPLKVQTFFNRLIAHANSKDTNLNIKPIKIKRAKVIIKEVEPFSLDEMQLILKSRLESPDLMIFLHIAFLTGARTGEILALTWEDIDFENNKILITKSLTPQGEITTPKTRSSVRYIDMLEPLRNYLINLPRIEGARLINTSQKHLRGQFYALLERLGIKRRVMYNTRHTFASLMLSYGEEPLWVGAMLGHKNLNITYSHYAKYIPQKKNRGVFLQGVIS